MRDKNPPIRPDAVGTYVRTVTIHTGGKDRDIQIEYTACLVDSEDIRLVTCTCWDGGCDTQAYADCLERLCLADSPLRVELAEFADYSEARACHK